MEIVMNVELEWDFSDPDMRRIADGFMSTPLLDQVIGKRDVNMIHIKQRTGANVFAETQAWQGRPIDYRLFVIIRHQDIEAILEAEELLFTLVEKIKSDLEDHLQSVRRPGSVRVVYSNNRITCGVCHASRQSSLKDFKLHVRSHIGDRSFYPQVPYKAPTARRPEPLAAPSRGAGTGAQGYDYASLMGQGSSGTQSRSNPSINYDQMLRDYRTMDDDTDTSFNRSRRRSRRRSRSPEDEDHYTYRKRRRRSRSGSYDSAERERMRKSLYMSGGGDQWSGGGSASGSRKRSGSSRYEQEMKKKPMYEQQAAMIDQMIEGARKEEADRVLKKQLEPRVVMTKKQRKMQAQNPQSWMSQDMSWMQDISSMVEKTGGRKGMGSSGNIPNVMNINLGEEHIGMADAAAWYAKQRMMGMQQQQQQQSGGYGGGMMGRGMGRGMMGQGMGQYSGWSGGYGGSAGQGGGNQSALYPSLMGMMKGPGGFQGGNRQGPMGGMGRGMPAMGGSGYTGGPGNFGGGGGGMQGGRRQRQQGPKGPAKTPKAPDTPIKLELRPGFIADITLCDVRESSAAMDSETTPPKISVDRSVDPLKDDDPVGSRYWKGMPPQATSAKSKPGKTEDGETVLPELQEEKEDAHPIPSTYDYKLRYQDLKTSAELLVKKIPTMTADALKTALGNIGEDVEPTVMKLIREKHKESVDKLKEDKYWLYKAQYEDVLNRTRQLGKLFCEYVTSNDYPVPEVKPDDGMDVLKIIMGKSEEMTAEKKVEKMEQFFTALLKQKDTADVSDEFWEERITLLKDCCGFNEPAHQNYIMKRINQLQESIVKRTSAIPSVKEAQSMELNVIYAMVNECLRQESTIETINSRLDMRSVARKTRKSEKLKSLQEDAKLKAEMWNLERQAEDGQEEEEDESEEEEEEEKKEAATKKKEDGEKEEIKENGKDQDEVKKEKSEEEMETEEKENGNKEEKEKDETEETKEEEKKEEKPKKEKKPKKPVEKIHPVIDDHPVTVSKESRRLWKSMLKVPVDKDLSVDECKELLEFLYETSPEDLYLRDVLSNFSWKKQVAAIEEIYDVPGMRYVCKDCGSGWFMFENCLAHTLICKKELALLCPMCPEPHIMDAKNMWRYIKHVKTHQENLEKFVEKVEKAEAEEKARIKAEEEAKVKAEEERKKAEEAKEKAEAEKKKKEEEEKAKAEKAAEEKAKKGETEEDMETKTDGDKEKEGEKEKEAEKTEEKMDEGEKETEEVKEKEPEEVKEKEPEEKKDEMEVDKEGKKDEETKDEKDEEKKTEEMEVEEEEEVSEAEEELEEDQIKKLPPMFASLYKSAGEILNDLEGMRLHQLESVLAVMKNMMKSQTMGVVGDLIEQAIQKDIRRETKKKSNSILKKYNDPSNRCREYIKVACKYIRKLRPGDEKQVKSIKEMDKEAKAEENKKKQEEDAKQADEEAEKAEEAFWAEEIHRKEDLAKRIAEQKKRKEEKRKALEKKKKEAEAKKKKEEAEKKKKEAEEEKKRKAEEAKKIKEEEEKKKKEEEEKTEKGDEEKKEGDEEMETEVKAEATEEKAEAAEEKKDEADKEEAAKEDEEEEMEEEEEEDIVEEPEPERPMPWENTSSITRIPKTMKTERLYYAMLEEAKKAKAEIAEMNTYKMDMTLQHFSTYLHHDDLRNIASLMRVEQHKERDQAIADPLHHLKLNLRVTLEYILNILPDAHEGFEHFREFINPDGKMKAEERFYRMEKFFTEVFRHLLESNHSHKYWHTRVQTIRKAMKLTDTKRQKHRVFIARKRNYLQEEELFRLNRNLTEMESVTIRLKVHCEVALAMDKAFDKLVEAINFEKSERISDEAEVAALAKEKEEFTASLQKFNELFVNQDKCGERKSDDELTDEEKMTFSHKHAIWWRGLLYDPVPQSVQRIPLNGQIAMFHNLMKDIPVAWLSLITVASRANKKDFNKWVEDMEKTTDGHYICGKCGFGTRKVITGLFHSLLCGKSGWTFCPLCKTDLQTDSMYWFDRHLERHVKHAEKAFAQCGKQEITLGFTLNELVMMLVNAANVIIRMREKDKDQKKADADAPEVECPSTEEKFNKTKETIKNILGDLDDLTNSELCDLGVQLRKAVGIKAMEDIREIVNVAIESERKSPEWNPAKDRYFKSSEARLGLTLKIGHEYMMDLEGHDISKSKGEVKDKTLKKYQEEHYTNDAEMLIVFYHQAVSCMRFLSSMSQQAMGYMEGKFNDIMRNDSTAEVGIVCQKEAERLTKENAGIDERDPTRINLKATCVYVLNMDDVEKKDGKEVKLERPNNSEDRFLALKKIVAHTMENIDDIPAERLQVVLQRMKGSIGEKQVEEVEAQIKEAIEKEKETPEWTEDKYENPVTKTTLEFKTYAKFYTNIPYPDPYDGIERLKETWKPAKDVKTDTKLQIAKEVFSMLLKQKKDTKLSEEYWRERLKAVIKCIGVVSSQEYYNPHYTWIRNNQSEEQVALKNGRYVSESEAMIQHLKVLFAQVSRVIKKELTPGNVMEDIDMRPISKKTINTPNLELLKEKFTKWAKEVLEGKVEEQKFPVSYDELKAMAKGDEKLEMQPINFADYKKTHKLTKLEAPNDELMKKVLKVSEESLKEGNKLEEIIKKIEFVDEGKYYDIDKRADPEEVTDKHKARLVEISIEKYVEGHYICGTCGSGFMMFDNCALHSLICGLEKVVVPCEWCAEPFSFKQYNLYLYRYQRHMEKHHQDLNEFIQATAKLPANPDAPVEEEEPETEEKEEVKTDKVGEEAAEKSEAKDGEEKTDEKAEDAKESEDAAKEAEKSEKEKPEEEEKMDTADASEEKLEESLLAGDDDVKDVQEAEQADEEKLLADSADTSMDTSGELDTSVAEEAKEGAEEAAEEEKPKPKRPQRATRGRKRGVKK